MIRPHSKAFQPRLRGLPSLENVVEALRIVLEGGDFRSSTAELFLGAEEPSEVLVNVESIIHLIEPCLPMS